jgi:2-methylcitrate dehydratase PrpD
MELQKDEGKMPRIRKGGLTRRGLLQLAGAGLASAALPSRVATATQQPPSPAKTGPEVGPVMGKLSTYMSEAKDRALPEDVVEKTKQHIVDTLAAMVSGSDLTPGRDAMQFARAYGGQKVATVAASDILCGPIEAALVNGMLAHADETDDSHAPSQSHPGCAVVPAALAAGERFGVDGTHFLRSVTLGYDIGPRFTVTLGGQPFESGSHWSTHSISPLFGAAAAAGCAASLNARQMRWLLGYTAQQSSGLASWQRDSEHVQKAFCFGGMTARSGVTSALVAQSNWTGVEDILSGADNFFQAYNPQADPSGLADALGERYEITRTNIKKWAVGSPIQAALDALEILRRQHPFEAAQVQEVSVQLATHEAGIVNNREIPDICLQHIVAVMLLEKNITFSVAHNQGRMKDPAVLRERAKVRLIPDDALQGLMPLRVAIVGLTLANGTHLTLRVDNVRGTPENPMTRDEVVAKARDLMAPILGAKNCATLIRAVLHLEDMKDIRELRPALQRA